MSCEEDKIVFKENKQKIGFRDNSIKLAFKDSPFYLKFDEQGDIIGTGERLADEDEGFLLVAYDSKPAYDFNVISKNYDPITIQYVEEEADLSLENYGVFSENGTKLIVADDNGIGTLAEIKEYSLSTPWRPNSATLINTFIPSQVTDVSDDHLVHVMIGGDNNDTLYVTYQEDTGIGTGNVTLIRYSLTSPYDLSSPTQQETEDVERSDNDGFPFYSDFKFNNDGTKAYSTPTDNDDTGLIYQYNLSLAWIFSSRSQEEVILKEEIPVTAGSGRVFAFLGDGTSLLINAGDPGAIKLDLDTAYDISSLNKIITKDPFSPESPQLRSLILTSLTSSFPSDPSYISLDEKIRELTEISVDINIYSLVDLKEFNLYITPEFQSEEFVETISATETSYIFTNLDTDKNYTLKVEAVDLDDSVVMQDSISTSTASDQLAFSEDSKTETSVTLSWTEDYHKINGYNLFVDGVQHNVGEISIAAAESGYLIDGLSAGTSYNISVEALDDQGSVLFTDSTGVSTLDQILNSLDDDFESYALGEVPTGWSQTSGSDRGWIVTDQRNNGGTQSFASDPNTTDDETAAIEVTIDLAAQNTLSFDYMASTEPGFDFLRFYIDGNLELEADNDTIWRQYSELISAGQHTLRFEFVKDGSIGSLDDRCYIDNILTTPT